MHPRASASARMRARSRATPAASCPTTSFPEPERSMRHEVFASFAGFDEFLVYLAVSLAYLAVFIAIYIRVTPWREIELIRAGNMAAAYSLAGVVVGFAVPLASAVENSVNIVDMAIWAL